MMMTDDMITVLIYSRGTECDYYSWWCIFV